MPATLFSQLLDADGAAKGAVWEGGAGSCVLLIDDRGRVRGLSDEAPALLKRSRHEIVDAEFAGFFDVADRERLERGLSLGPAAGPARLRLRGDGDASLELRFGRRLRKRMPVLMLAVPAVEDAVAPAAPPAVAAEVADLSHEMRTPLNAVIGFAQLLERDPDLNREQREHLTAILSSGEHLLHLINDVLSLSKIEAGKMSLTIAQFDLHRTLEGVEAMLRGRTRAKGLQLTVVRDPDVPRFVLGDEGKLRQIMINLLGNAVKFTDAGSITLRAAWQDGIGIFDVEDTGHGIAEEELENLFEAFVQTESGRKSKEGTGLGLAISRNFVQMMGGDMRVRSTLGKGTTFSFDAELAAVTEGGDRIETRRIVALESGQPEFRILVVDDVERNRTVLVKLLEAVGFVVDEAADGREAVAKWSSWRPDLILMDKRMPLMDGLAATREIRRLEAEFEDAALPEFEGAPVPPVGRTVIISLSASAFEHEHAEILGAGSDEIITKPFRHERLFEALSRHLGARFESYLDDEDLEASIAPSEAPSPDRLRELPSEWVASLVEAVVRGDVEQCVTIVDRIGERDEELASHLRTLVRSYRFDDIQLLIEESLSA